MPANLPPQFFELQKKLKKTSEIEEKILILKEMLAICPKHKGTERVREEIKRKMARLRKEAQKTKKGKRGIDFYTVLKEGAGQVVVIGPPNSGKTSLVNLLAKSQFKVADYPFSTTLPQPAMMSFENIQIQLVDTPPLTKEFCPGWMKNLVLNCDLILAVFDVTDPEIQTKIKEIKEILKNWRTDGKEILFLGNKSDLLEKEKQKEILENTEIEFLISTKKPENENVFALKKKIFEKLKIVRVYSKKPGKKPDFERPFIFKKGTKLLDLIEEINPQILSKFKHAKLFRKDLLHPKIVGKDYELKDEDIIEIR